MRLPKVSSASIPSIPARQVLLTLGSLAIACGLITFQAWLFGRLAEQGHVSIRTVFTLEALLFVCLGIGLFYYFQKFPVTGSRVAEVLSKRELEVFRELVTGKTNAEIMAALFIEKSTLKTHINNIYRKLDIRNREELKRRFS